MTTIWLKAHDLIKTVGLTSGTPERESGCVCAGGAIAKVITGRAYDLYDWRTYPELEEALTKFADHIESPTLIVEAGEEYDVDPDERVHYWNDGLFYQKNPDPQGAVLKALMELHEAEVNND